MCTVEAVCRIRQIPYNEKKVCDSFFLFHRRCIVLKDAHIAVGSIAARKKHRAADHSDILRLIRF